MAILISGCYRKNKLEQGFDYTFTPHPIMIGARSETDTFKKDSVCFNLYYGVYDIGYNRKYNYDPRIPYKRDGYDSLIFAVYICDTKFISTVQNDMEFDDYKIIQNHYFVREISEKDAFSAEYGFTLSYTEGITYNHKETITIPSDIFSKDRGSFAIKIASFNVPFDEKDNYFTGLTGAFEIAYEIIDHDTVKIKF